MFSLMCLLMQHSGRGKIHAYSGVGKRYSCWNKIWCRNVFMKEPPVANAEDYAI
jgi:hypothetical protein